MLPRSLYYAVGVLLTVSLQNVRANPTGGTVASGSATIQGGSGITTVTQYSHAAIINWQNFSINPGETTHFIQPSAQSAALNRVLGGKSSLINGTLSANGQVYLINQNGILVGPGGVVNAAGGFTASTRDITDSDFLKGNAHFVGHNSAGVRNLGVIKSQLGNVTLIGKTVGNRGTIQANNGTAGLVAGDDVLLGQNNPDGSSIMVNTSPLSKSASGKSGVTNQGRISAASAELKAANGNIYALAINNSGTIRSTTVSKQGGHVWLTSDNGVVANSGTIKANALAPAGHGGSVIVKSTAGTVNDSGSIIAEGGAGGTGGYVDLSADKLKFTGTVNLGAFGGKKGLLYLDPTYLEVVNGGSGTISGGENDSASTIDPSIVENALVNGSVELNADYGITITDGISWSSGQELALVTNYAGSYIQINNAISSSNGLLFIETAGSTDPITTSSAGSVSVNVFELYSGAWSQNGNLPAFSANDFVVVSPSTYLRVAGGDGSGGNPYQITDVYGLQGIQTSATYKNSTYTQINDIDATVTANWNGGQGFVPINLNGTYNGGGYVINGLTINSPQAGVALFSSASSISVIENVNLTNVNITGQSQLGGLVGDNDGEVLSCSVSGNISSAPNNNQVGGLVGFMSLTGSIMDSTSSANVTTGSNTTQVGGLVGENDGEISGCSVFGNVNSASNQVGGMVGYMSPSGSINDSTSAANVIAGSNMEVGGLIGENDGDVLSCTVSGTVTTGANSLQVGGLVGYMNSTGSVIDSSSSATVTVGTSTSQVGDLVGGSDGVIDGCSASGVVYVPAGTGNAVGGIAGYSGSGTLADSFNTATITSGVGTQFTGGIVGISFGTIYNCSSSGTVTGGSLVGGIDGLSEAAVNNCSSTSPVYGSGTEIGGLVGENDGSILDCYSLGPVTGGSGSGSVGGFVGLNYGSINTSYSTGSVAGDTTAGPLGGFVGTDQEGTIADCYYATDGSGQTVGVGSQNGTTITYDAGAATDVTGYTTAQLTRSKNFDSAWDFTPGTGVWGINATSSIGSVNNGLPFFQSQIPVVASFTPLAQSTVYNQTNAGTGFSTSAFTETLASDYTSVPLTGTPIVVVVGSNVNAGTLNPLTVATTNPVNSGYAIETLSGGAETITPLPITVSALSGITSVYGNIPSFGTDGGGSQVLSGDVLGGTTAYSINDTLSPGGYLNSGSFTYLPQITGYNTNYTITGYNPGTFTITPATLSYVANSANGAVGQSFPAFSGSINGFLPGDTQGNATLGTLQFSTTATSDSSSGLYAINGGGLTSGNYVFIQDPGNATAFNLAPAGTVLPTLPNSPTSDTGNVIMATIAPPASGVDATSYLQSLINSSGGVNQALLSSQVSSGSVGSSFNSQSGGNGGFVGSNNGGGSAGFGGGDNSDSSNTGGGGGLSDSSSVSGEVGGDGSGDDGGNGNGGGGHGGRGDKRGGKDGHGNDNTADGNGHGSGHVVDQNGHPAAGFYTRGGFSGFSPGPVPGFVQTRLATVLAHDVRDALFNANKASAKADHGHGETTPSNGATGSHAVIGTIVDQHGQAVRGFYAAPGGYFGFGGTPLPPLIQAHISKALGGDVRDQLLNATK